MRLDQNILRHEFVQATSSRVFGLSVSLTEQCNFRCAYCYEQFDMKRMPHDVFERLKLLVAKRMPGLKRFELNWFGGEPLLEWRRIAEFTAYCRRLAESHAVAMIPASMPTNAWALTPQLTRELTDAGVGLFMVSLDGAKESHDKTRRTISGRGTFDRIYCNLRALRDSDLPFQIVLRLHLHQDNIASQGELACVLVKDFASDVRFSFEPVGLGDFGGPTIHTVRLVDAARVEQFAADLFGPLKAPRRTPALAQRVCYAAQPNRLFIRPDGNAYKCTSALERSDNLVGTLTDLGCLSLDERKVSAWAFGFHTGESGDLACPLKTKDRPHVMRFIYKNAGTRTRLNAKDSDNDA